MHYSIEYFEVSLLQNEPRLKKRSSEFPTRSDTNRAIHHICINPPPPLFLLVTWISNIGFCEPGNQQINANMVNTTTEDGWRLELSDKGMKRDGTICVANKGTDQLRGYHEADPHLVFAHAKSQLSYDAAQMILSLLVIIRPGLST